MNYAAAPSGLARGISYGAKVVDLVLAPMSGAQVFGNITTASLDRAQSLADLVENRFGDAACRDGSGSDCSGWRSWAQGIRDSDRMNTGAAAGFTNTSTGFIGGIDHRWANGATAGVAFAYDDENLAMGQAVTSGKGSGYYGALYGRWSLGQTLLDGQAFFLHNDWRLNRTVTGYGIATSQPSGNTVGFLGQASRPLLGESGLSGYARLSVASFDRSDVTETGAGLFGFTVAGSTTTTLTGETGLQYSQSFSGAGGREYRPALQIGVQDGLNGSGRDVTAMLSGVSQATPFTTSAMRGGNAAAIADAALKVKLTDQLGLQGDLRGRFSGDQEEFSASLGATLRF